MCLLIVLLFCGCPGALIGESNQSPAVLTSPTPGGILPGTSVTFSWTAGNGVAAYALYLGTTGPGSYDLYYPGASTATSATVTDLPTNGVTIYATLFSLIGGTWQSIPYTYISSVKSLMATLTSPTPGVTFAGSSVGFSWTTGSHVTAYALHLSTIRPLGKDLFDSGIISAKSITVTGLPTSGATIYATLYSEIDGVWFPASYTYTEAGPPAALSTLSCSSLIVIGAATDTCKVTLTAAAPSGGLTVSLSSTSWAVDVPSTVTVPANASSAVFTATVSAVETAQAVTVTAKAGKVSRSLTITLLADLRSLQISATSIAFGNVAVGSTATQELVLISIGLAPVTISADSLSGSNFTAPGVSFPVTLNPGQAMVIDIEFKPTAAGAVAGQLTLTSNSSTGSSIIGLSGIGSVYAVNLAWDAPSSSSVPVAGYHIYRAQSGSSKYALLNSILDPLTSYLDGTVSSGNTYDYVIESVSSSGVESSPSSVIAVTIP